MDEPMPAIRSKVNTHRTYYKYLKCDKTYYFIPVYDERYGRIPYTIKLPQQSKR